MTKLRFLLLDANVIIKLFELKLWDKLIEKCEILVAETVTKEAQFCFDDVGQQAIDLAAHAAADQIKIVSLTATEVAKFRDQFTPDYLERVDPGEAESLAFLLASKDPCLLCSADAIVFRVLGRLNCPEQGISLEEALQKSGFTAVLPRQYRRAFREQWTQVGQENLVRDVGLK